MRPVATAAAAAAAVLLLAACAHGPRAAQGDPRTRATGHIYEQPIEKVWPHVRAHFEEAGYRIRADGNHWSLETEWHESFTNSEIAGVFTRYIVLGDPLGPTRSRIRVFRMQRTNNKTLNKPGEEILWGPRPDIGAQGPGAMGQGPAGSASLQRWSDGLDEGDGHLRAEATGASASRDLELEWALLQKIDPAAAAQYEAGKEVIARSVHPSPQVAVPAPASQLAEHAQVDCGEVIPGLSRTARAGQLLLLGELHGTREAPQFVGNAACQAALSGLPVTIALELPTDEQARVINFLASDGGAAATARLLDGPFWARPYQDGRSSTGMLELLEKLRSLRHAGQDVQVFAFDEPRLQGNAHEEAVTRHLSAHVTNNPERFFIVLSGNVHNRLQAGTAWAPDLEPMGLRLSRAFGDRVTSLDFAYASGTAWICSVDGRLDCGVRPARGRDNGARPFIHYWDGRKDGYDGIFYVGAVNAAPPAIGVADANRAR